MNRRETINRLRRDLGQFSDMALKDSRDRRFSGEHPVGSRTLCRTGSRIFRPRREARTLFKYVSTPFEVAARLGYSSPTVTMTVYARWFTLEPPRRRET
jgi:hypothetical protein